jgi:hypothetical protein
MSWIAVSAVNPRLKGARTACGTLYRLGHYRKLLVFVHPFNCITRNARRDLVDEAELIEILRESSPDQSPLLSNFEAIPARTAELCLERWPLILELVQSMRNEDGGEALKDMHALANALHFAAFLAHYDRNPTKVETLSIGSN